MVSQVGMGQQAWWVRQKRREVSRVGVDQQLGAWVSLGV